MKVNSYNFEQYGCVFFHAIATSEQHAIELANEAGFDIEGLTIELERENVRDELGRAYEPKIENALVY